VTLEGGIVEESVTKDGNAFQTRVPATGKERSPIVVLRVGGTTSAAEIKWNIRIWSYHNLQLIERGHRFGSHHCNAEYNLGKSLTHMCIRHQAVLFGNGKRRATTCSWQRAITQCILCYEDTIKPDLSTVSEIAFSLTVWNCLPRDVKDRNMSTCDGEQELHIRVSSAYTCGYNP